MKIKKQVLAPALVIVCIILYAAFARPAIERHTWVLTYAQQTVPPYSVVAHNSCYDPSYDPIDLFTFSKEIELTCVAKDGKLVLTDQTDHKTYQGTYEVSSFGKLFGRYYTIAINGKEGTANISSGFHRTLFVSIGDYTLNFEVQ